MHEILLISRVCGILIFYIRLIDQPQQWKSRGHFFGAAAQAMRRILVDQARKKKSLKAGGDRHLSKLMPKEMDAFAHQYIDRLAMLNESADRIVDYRIS